MDRFIRVLGCAYWAVLVSGHAPAASAEYNPIRTIPVAIGPEANRLIVGFRAASSDAVQRVAVRRGAGNYSLTQALTTAADARSLALRAGVALAASRQITPSMHVLLLPKTLYGAEVLAALAKLRADPAVKFADVDARRYALALPTNPLFLPTTGASGQWYLQPPNPSSIVLEGNPTMDLSATDAVDAWNLTTGSPGIVIADVDTGVIFGHPDLLRAGPASLGAGFGGRLLPGYDFVGVDYNTSSPFNALGTYLIANDGDGWDPDPSDPGDWITSADTQNALFSGDTVAPSSWHGTRVVGVYGAITNNDVGTAGMTWGSSASPGPWILPVRALGKGGGYDSDIIAGIEWAAGMVATNPDGSAVPQNPYPADIINLSIGGTPEACPSDYQDALTAVTGLGVLVVVSAGNGGTAGQPAPVNAPGSCSAVVPGVLTVAGLRNVGTKVGYSSFGAEISVSAPAGNCIQLPGDCLRSIDTTTNLGATGPGANGYTNETNSNLGTSFSAPIVSGIAGLMRSVNGKLTPAQLVQRIKSSATKFPGGAAGVPTCPTNDPSSGECVCPNDGSQCGAGMVNAYNAVLAAQNPIAVVVIAASSSTLDAGASAASCHRTIASYAWSASGGAGIVPGSPSSNATWSGSGTVTLIVTDNLGGNDMATITVKAGSATSSAPTTAGSAAACPPPINPDPTAPAIRQSFLPASVPSSMPSTLTIALTNANGFALTQSNFTQTMPSGLTIATTPAPATTCTGANVSVTATANTVTLSDANIPANGECSVTLSVSASKDGSYTSAVPANALMTASAGGNAKSSSAALMVSTPPPSSSGGGGALDWLGLSVAGGLVWATRRRGPVRMAA